MRFGSQARDKTAPLPQFDIVAVYGLLCLLDGLLIISAFDIFGMYKLTAKT
jgi:hypothetical protein